MVKPICSNCKHWTRFIAGEGPSNRGHCHSDKFIDASEYGFESKEESDTLEYRDYESYKAEFTTGESFGCIHFEEGEPK